MSKQKQTECPKSEYSEDFWDKMKNRMAISYYRYGPINTGFPHKISAIKSLELRLKKYKEDGNLEHLIDIANYAMIEYLLPAHENVNFTATDNKDSPGRIWHSGGPANKRSNNGTR